MERLAHAKINLRLCVLAQERSGYHQIETLLLRIALADTLRMEVAGEFSLSVTGPDSGPVQDNLVLRAARAFVAHAGIEGGAAFHLTKRIPVGAGLGGGSSDAAAALHLLNETHGRPLDMSALLALAITIGSDVPFFVQESPFALAWGRGERILSLPAPPVRPALVIMPAQHIATPAAYKALAELRSGTPPAMVPFRTSLRELGDWTAIDSLAGNDFEPVAERLVPSLAAVRRALFQAGARIAQISGSGSATFALFDTDTQRDSASLVLTEQLPGFAVMTTETLSG